MIGETARKGDRRATLLALRDRLADELDDCDSKRDVAALALRLQSVLAELAEFPDKSVEPTPLEQLQARREARQAGRPLPEFRRAD